MNKKSFRFKNVLWTILFLFGIMNIIGKYYYPFSNITTVYPAIFLWNVYYGNFKDNEALQKVGVKIKIPMYKYAYNIRDYNDSIQVHFKGKKVDDNLDITAFMSIYKNDEMLKVLRKIEQERECDLLYTKRADFDRKFSVCEKKNYYPMAYFDDYEHGVFVIFSPYIKETDKEFREFLKGIVYEDFKEK